MVRLWYQINIPELLQNSLFPGILKGTEIHYMGQTVIWKWSSTLYCKILRRFHLNLKQGRDKRYPLTVRLLKVMICCNEILREDFRYIKFSYFKQRAFEQWRSRTRNFVRNSWCKRSCVNSRWMDRGIKNVKQIKSIITWGNHWCLDYGYLLRTIIFLHL